MALPSSPPISLNDVCDEFQVPRTTPLTSFLRGGGIVPDTAANANVPTALPISLLQLLGAVRTLPLSLSKSGNATGSYFCQENPVGNAASCPLNPSVSTNAVTVTASGGTGADSVSWQIISGSAFTISAPSSATTAFSINIARERDAEATRSAIARCTWNRGGTVATIDVPVTATYTEFTGI